MTPNPTLSTRRSNSPGIRLLRQILRNRSAQIGGILLLILVFASYAAPLFTEDGRDRVAREAGISRLGSARYDERRLGHVQRFHRRLISRRLAHVRLFAHVLPRRRARERRSARATC